MCFQNNIFSYIKNSKIKPGRLIILREVESQIERQREKERERGWERERDRER